MASVPTITAHRRRRRQQPAPQRGRLWGWGCSLLASLAFVMLVFSCIGLYAQITHSLPALQTLPYLLDPPSGLLLQPTEFYDRSGRESIYRLENPAIAGRTYLTIGEDGNIVAPSSLISATLATADVGFWQHAGYQLWPINPDNHPTLAQKLVADFLLWDEAPTLRRALRERLLAAQITARFGRQQILAWYLNSASYGNLVYGADAAARVYFGKPAAELNLAEAVALAGVAETPALNPHDAPQATRERARLILERMLKNGIITDDQYRQALDENLQFQQKTPVAVSPQAAFVELAIDSLAPDLPRSLIERGGLRIITTLDFDLQAQAVCASAALLGRQVDRADSDPSACRAARLLPAAPQGSEPELASGVAMLDPQNGELLAFTADPALGLDPARAPARPPGTLLSPLIYLAGFTQGFSPATLLWDIPEGPLESGGDLQAYHGPVRLRNALANDYTGPLAGVLRQVGAENVWRIARQLGLQTAILPSDAVALLASGEVSLLEISHVYSAFANLGVLVGQSRQSTGEEALRPILVQQAVDRQGRLWYEAQSPQTKPVISPQLAYLVDHILSDEPARWPSLGHPNALEIGRPVAAKLGRTAGGTDAWAIGYTPQLLVGVWLGNLSEEPATSAQAQDAAVLWHALIQDATRDQPPEGWPAPAGISTRTVCDPSGLLPTEDCPTTVAEVFISGSEPVQVDSLYRRLFINRETGRQATVFTPPELVEERVYLIVPPFAAQWATQSGLPMPPEQFDIIPAEPRSDPDAHLTAPEMFSYLSGEVEITGSARGEGFLYYRLQAGKGLNPQEWLLIGEDTSDPASESRLGVWDTLGLNGLYALQLLVVYDDQRVETAITQVTLDNVPPNIAILTPQDGQRVDRQTPLIIQAEVSDDLALNRVVFLIDGKQLAAFEQGPYRVEWQPETGQHTLQIRAADRAGNLLTETISFTVP